MKVCYYNWVDFDDLDNRGGGVTVYQKNIMASVCSVGIDPYFISSGVYYKPPFKKCFFVKKNNKIRIYNSPVLAPAHMSFGSSNQLRCDDVENVFIAAIKKIGDVDIIHFNNIEGLSVGVFSRLKKEIPNIKIVLSIHNYYPFCPQVNLWQDEVKNCKNFNFGKNCLGCVENTHSELSVKKAYYLSDVFEKFGIKKNGVFFKKFWKISVVVNRIYSKLFFRFPSVSRKDFFSEGRIIYFRDRRKIFIESINKYIDQVLCVSDRVRDICLSFGLNEIKCKTMYIGTNYASDFNENKKNIKTKSGSFVTIAYLGYMRKDKGFYFFLDALSKIDESISRNVKLVVAAREDGVGLERLKIISRKYHSLDYYDGYSHNNINKILDGVDVGIVPPLWEDNLPQVAIEMHCKGIPILTSSTGGASELHNNNPLFTFKSGDFGSFKEVFERLITIGVDKKLYFSNVLEPLSMNQHLNELNVMYKELVK